MITVVRRPLRYPRDWPNSPAQEKGIDVALAVDFTAMALLKRYDVGILFSTDTDMKYALEFVLAETRARPEVAAWRGQRGRLEIEGRNLWCHWVREPVYRQVVDPVVYSKK